MSDIKAFDDKKKSNKKDNKVSKDIATTIKNTMWLWLSELEKTIKWWANKKEVNKQESVFVINKWNQILPSEDKRENEKIEKRKHISQTK